MATLLVVASSIPLAIGAFLDVRQSRADLTAGMENLLSARAEQVARELDSIHAGYLGSARRLAKVPVTEEYCAGGAAQRARLQARLQGTFATFPATDTRIRGVGLIDSNGVVVAATRPQAVGLDHSRREGVRAALGGTISVSGIYVSDAATGSEPTVTYLIPVQGNGPGANCVLGAWVYGRAFADALKMAHGRAGAGSYASVFDELGIRIANSRSDVLRFRPGGPVDAAVVEQLVVEARFGPDTRALMQDVQPAPERFARARATVPDQAMFRSEGNISQQWSYGVAHRLKSLPWTVFYMVPEQNLQAQIASATREKALIGLGFIVGAALLGLWFASGILRPVRALAGATAALAAGDSGVRVTGQSGDELGRLGNSFNAMANRLEAQARELKSSNEDLERRVRERTALLNGVMENAAAAIALKDLDGRFLLVNDRAAALFQRPRQEILGRTIEDVLEPAAAARMRELDRRAAASDTPVVEERTSQQDDGAHTYLVMKCRLLNDARRPYGIVTIATDITERKNAETRVLDQLERLKLLDQITCAVGARHDLHSIYQEVIRSLEERFPVDLCCICIHDPEAGVLRLDRKIAHAGPLAARLGLDTESAIPLDQNGLARCMQGELVYEPDTQLVPFPFPRRLAGAGLHSLVLAPLAAEGRVFGVLAVARREAQAFSSVECEFLRQLSAHVALAAQQAGLNEALQTANDELRQTQQTVLQQERLSALGQMASGIAHDINNAITPVTLYTEALLQSQHDLSPRARSYLEVISRAIDDVAATVARMREFYRPRETRTALVPVDLNEMVRQAVALTHARWSDIPQQRGIFIDLQQDLAAGLPCVLAVESEIREALINLVFNAVDAMPEGGRLELRTRVVDDGRHVALDVADSGVGMDEETRAHCLEPFFTTKGERGTGLGLAMVYGVAQRNNADLTVDSTPGLGTRVTMRFPLTGVQGAVAVAAPAVTPEVSSMRILLIDDDAVLLRSLRDALEAQGHQVQCSLGGKAGLAVFQSAMERREAFDAVITDLGMAHMDGRQVAQAIRLLDGGVHVILLTGWGLRLIDDGEIPPGVDRVLSKPPRLNDLRTALHDLAAARNAA